MREAQVRCLTCKQKIWVKWDYRHDGKSRKTEHYHAARCPSCPTDKDFTAYTGIFRGDDDQQPEIMSPYIFLRFSNGHFRIPVSDITPYVIIEYTAKGIFNA